ncbi:hypothetical protein [Mesorhizobium sp. DCY119]|uniref:hypothetical protein n=1 Tax=Mesorhizobium sp. DCY119 TaxID=2108445 RepID=UPI000E6B9B1D|nr:hypothetical protein [Mesorhizobium sp. DCY119]RJG42866.1 hypothetical protein D3Y55_00300 [Mesorhizobium sp. DCY119]
MPRFTDTHVFRAQIFSLGIDNETGGFYLSTPINEAFRAAEFEAYYAISEAEYRLFAGDPALAGSFTEDCRMGRGKSRRLA